MDDLRLSFRRGTNLVDKLRLAHPLVPVGKIYQWQESLDAIWALYDNRLLDAAAARRLKLNLEKQIRSGVKQYANPQ